MPNQSSKSECLQEYKQVCTDANSIKKDEPSDEDTDEESICDEEFDEEELNLINEEYQGLMSIGIT